MLTITSKVQLNAMRQQRNALTFESMMLSNQIQMYTDGMDAVQYQNPNMSESDLKQTEGYRMLIAAEEACEERQKAVDTELALLDEEIKAWDGYHQGAIGNDTQYFCFSGG